MQPHVVYESAGVASISAKITETLEQFDAQLLAVERALEMLRTGLGHACRSAPGQEFSETKHPSNESAPVSPAETSVIQ